MVYNCTRRIPRGRSEDALFRDDERRSLSNDDPVDEVDTVSPNHTMSFQTAMSLKYGGCSVWLRVHEHGRSDPQPVIPNEEWEPPQSRLSRREPLWDRFIRESVLHVPSSKQEASGRDPDPRRFTSSSRELSPRSLIHFRWHQLRVAPERVSLESDHECELKVRVRLRVCTVACARQ